MLRTAAVLTLLAGPAAAQGLADYVSENLYACQRGALPVTYVSRDVGRPWIAVLWADGNLVTLHDVGTLEAPHWQQSDDGEGYDWKPLDEISFELGWTGEDGQRQVVERCWTDEGGA